MHSSEPHTCTNLYTSLLSFSSFPIFFTKTNTTRTRDNLIWFIQPPTWKTFAIIDNLLVDRNECFLLKVSQCSTFFLLPKNNFFVVGTLSTDGIYIINSSSLSLPSLDDVYIDLLRCARCCRFMIFLSFLFFLFFLWWNRKLIVSIIIRISHWKTIWGDTLLLWSYIPFLCDSRSWH